MEVFNPDNQTFNTQCSAIIQSGAGVMDQYIYSQDGEGIASFFGNLFRSAIPLFSKDKKAKHSNHSEKIISAIFSAISAI